MTWVFVMFMHGFTQDMSVFPSQQECEQAVAVYNDAFKKTDTRAVVWCERRGQRQPRPRA